VQNQTTATHSAFTAMTNPLDHTDAQGSPALHAGRRSVLLIGLSAALVMMSTLAPAHAQRCFTQNGQKICCDNSGNCYSR
jgi:hypothetical protein